MPITKVLFSFKGRIPRATFWFAYAGVTFFFILILYANAPTLPMEQHRTNVLDVLGNIVMVLMLYSHLAIFSKRWHDLDKSAWWILIIMIPFIGILWALAECGFAEGTAGPNKYGDDPLAVATQKSDTTLA